jgi:hypothetical protein
LAMTLQVQQFEMIVVGRTKTMLLLYLVGTANL